MAARQELAYGKVAGAYDAFLTLTGFKRGLGKFLDRQDFPLPERAKILDAGCGTGLVALYLARRFPIAEIYAADIDRNMLGEMAEIAKREGLRERLAIVESDLCQPERMREVTNGREFSVPPGHFDLITVSGALEHVPLGETLGKLHRLLKPGGLLLNIGLRKNPAGAVLGLMYHCRPYEISELRRAFAAAEFTDIRVLRLKTEDFPTNLSRVAVSAKKP